jgi:pimeloyl-ACP methyl ester carboxylesterase
MKKKSILFLHGLGSSAAAYDSVVELLAVDGFDCITHHSPGFGTRADEIVPETGLIEFFLDDLLDQHNLPPELTIVAHSIGGVFALKLLERRPEIKCKFVFLEANLVSSDCGMLSRSFAQSEIADVDNLRTQCIEKLRGNASAGWRKWCNDVALARPETIRSYSKTAVENSDSGKLLTAYLAHPMPKIYVYGDEYVDEPVLNDIALTPVEYIEGASHFLMPDAAGRVAEIVRMIAIMT